MALRKDPAIPALVTLAFAALAATAACVGTDQVSDPVASGSPLIMVAPVSGAAEVGQGVSFRAIYFDKRGRVVTSAAIEWSSSDESVATIDAGGRANGLKPGQTMILAESDGVRGNVAQLTVVAGALHVASVRVTPTSGRLEPGSQLQLSASAFDLSGNPIPGAVFDWSSSDPAVASVDSAGGLVSALSPGSASIRAASSGVASLPALIEVLGRLRSGSFEPNPSTSYQVSGTATLRESGGGRLVLTLESDYRSSSGPGLHVFLSRTSAITSTSLDLGPIQSFNGFQEYDVPTGVDLSAYDWVVIRCVPFSVTFGYAELGSAR